MWGQHAINLQVRPSAGRSPPSPYHDKPRTIKTDPDMMSRPAFVFQKKNATLYLLGFYVLFPEKSLQNRFSESFAGAQSFVGSSDVAQQIVQDKSFSPFVISWRSWTLSMPQIFPLSSLIITPPGVARTSSTLEIIISSYKKRNKAGESGLTLSIQNFHQSQDMNHSCLFTRSAILSAISKNNLICSNNLLRKRVWTFF